MAATSAQRIGKLRRAPGSAKGWRARLYPPTERYRYHRVKFKDPVSDSAASAASLEMRDRYNTKAVSAAATLDVLGREIQSRKAALLAVGAGAATSTEQARFSTIERIAGGL